MRKWWFDNKTRLSENHKKWAKRNREYRRQYNREWLRSKPGLSRRYFINWITKNPEAYKLSKKKSAIKHRVRIRRYMKEYHKRYYPKNRLKIIAQTKEYARKNPEVRSKIYRKIKAKYPERIRAYCSAGNAKRRARKKGADVGDKYVGKLIRKWRLEDTFVCYYCQKKFSSADLQIEHIIPLSRGGKHTVGNICKSCPRCNRVKNTKLVSAISINGQSFLL